MASFFCQDLVWWWGVRPLCKVFSSTSQRFSVGLRSGLCGGQSMFENDVSCSLYHSFTDWARWIVVFSFWNMQGIKKSIDEKKYSFSLSTSLWSEESRHYAWWVHYFIPLSSYPDASITVEQTTFGLIRPHVLFPLVHHPILMLPSKLKAFFSN